jgi:hypothetical protein
MARRGRPPLTPRERARRARKTRELLAAEMESLRRLGCPFTQELALTRLAGKLS